MPRDNLESGPSDYMGWAPSDDLMSLLMAAGAPSGPVMPSQNWGDPSWGTWEGGKSFRAPTEFEIARGSIPDAAKGAENDFAPNQQNAQLLNALGYSGQALQNGAWTRDALDWLHGSGYQVGVGHAKGSESGGRPEYWGLIDSAGKYVQGQADPTMTISDTPMEIATPFLMMLPAIAGIAAAGAGAAGGGAGAAAGGAGGAGAAGGAGSLGALPADLFSSIGQGMMTGAGGAAGGGMGASLGGLLEGVAAASGAAAGTSGMGGGLSSADAAALYGDAGYGAGMTGAETAAYDGALGGAGASVGNAGGLSSADKAAMYGNEGYGAGMSGTQTSVYDGLLNTTGSKGLADLAANSTVGSGLLDGVKGVSDLVGGGSNLAGLIGAAAGAADSGGTNTATTQSQIDPRMAQYLYGSGYGDQNSFLGAAQKLWQDNRSGINPTMQAGLDMQRSALQDPAYGQAYQQMRTQGMGLLNQPMAGNPFSAPGAVGAPGMAGGPNAQAGGVGGLLGGSASDRARSLISRGRGLLG